MDVAFNYKYLESYLELHPNEVLDQRVAIFKDNKPLKDDASNSLCNFDVLYHKKLVRIRIFYYQKQSKLILSFQLKATYKNANINYCSKLLGSP